MFFYIFSVRDFSGPKSNRSNYVTLTWSNKVREPPAALLLNCETL